MKHRHGVLIPIPERRSKSNRHPFQRYCLSSNRGFRSMGKSQCLGRYVFREKASVRRNQIGTNSNTSGIGRLMCGAGRFTADPKPLVYRFRSLETLCRSIDRDAVSNRIRALASLLAKQIQRRRADLRPGYFPQPHPENFFQFEARKLPTPSGVSAERPNSSEFFGRGNQLFLRKRFFYRYRSFQRRDRIQAGRLGAAHSSVFTITTTSTWKKANVVNPEPRLAERDHSRKGIFRTAGGLRSKFTCVICRAITISFPRASASSHS